MAELTPITPNPFVPNVKKIERDEKRKGNEGKPSPQPNDETDGDRDKAHRPAQHIDEIV